MDRANEALTAAGRRASPALISLLLQMATWLAALPVLIYGQPLLHAMLLQGAAVGLLSWWVGLPGWWRLINPAFFPLVWLVARADIQPAWFLAGFLLLALTSLGTLRHRVPLYLSSRQAVEGVSSRLPERHGLKVVDLGCGLGGMLAGLAERRADLRLYGVEMAPFNWLVSRLRLTGTAEVRLGSLWEANLADYDVVYAYLSPAPMRRLWDKVGREMRPGGLFISNSFCVPGVEPDEIIELNDFSHARLLIWRR